MTATVIIVFLCIFASLVGLGMGVISAIESYQSETTKRAMVYAFLSGLCFSYGFRVLDALYKIM